MSADNESLQVILASLKDVEALVASAKVQRWDVVKWVVTVNSAITTVVALHRELESLVALTAAVAAMGVGLVAYHNTWVTHARRRQSNMRRYLYGRYAAAREADPSAYFGEKKETFDWPEMAMFFLAMAASAGGPLLFRLS